MAMQTQAAFRVFGGSRSVATVFIETSRRASIATDSTAQSPSLHHSTTPFSPGADDGRGGQALVEFMIGLVAVLVLFAGLLQVASLSRIHTDTMVEARRLAAEQAMLDVDTLTSPDYIHDWQQGDDQKSYTRDDNFTTANPSDFDTRIVDRAGGDTDGWDLIDSAPGSRFPDLHGSSAPGSLFGLVEGTDSGTIDLLPAVQHLIYAAPSIQVRCNVWMTRTKGLY